ncbi:MAG: Crp/Fnr family transcriptional regulator [Betaproteobacteria bacterium HGW-Betaproteobacteria-10]|nr:MAG: Crp/Fnr family transcriptional regulator [Betaproteobacteria bacterium HGW-Betaproteobacteria-10]
MSLFFTVDRKQHEVALQGRNLPAIRSALNFDAGQSLYDAGGEGLAWRVRHGVVRLDTLNPAGEMAFASLAINGDILGCETLLFGTYTFSAAALTRCELTPWPEGESATVGESLLESLAIAQQRAADIVALRGGQAIDRVIGLIRLLAAPGNKVILPTRQNIADITNLRFETISRLIKGLERAGVLSTVRIDGVHATRAYTVNLNALSS